MSYIYKKKAQTTENAGFKHEPLLKLSYLLGMGKNLIQFSR